MQIRSVNYNYTNQKASQRNQQNFGELAFTSPQDRVALYRKVRQCTPDFIDYFTSLVAESSKTKELVLTDGETWILGMRRPISTMTLLEELCTKLEDSLNNPNTLPKTTESLVKVLKKSPIVNYLIID